MAEALLAVDGLTKCFGALVASDAVGFAVAPGSCHALIGPNGAGKTTAIAQIAGEVRPDAGSIRFAGQDITTWPIHRRAGLGLQRSYQVTSLFGSATALGNVTLAILARERHAFRFWQAAATDPALRAPALAALDRVGLAGRADVPVTDLAHGEQRQLELAMVLATRPKMVLLDEPTAGMGRAETRTMRATLRRLKDEGLTILLVEHDMDVVFALADVITVLVKGRVVVTGPPQTVRDHDAVRAAYLGTS